MKKIVYTLIIALFIACGDDNDPQKEKENAQDNTVRKEMLNFWAEDIIIPGYKDFAAKTTEMNTAVKTFIATPSESGLTNARATWKEAYISWQKVSLFQIGEAQSLNLAGSMNTYPTDVNYLLDFVKSDKEPNFASTNLKTIQGFPALDYLLNGVGETDTEIVAYYKNEQKVKEYLGKVSAYLNTIAVAVSDDWGTYKAKFIAKDGNSSTSSVNKVVNYYIIPFFEKQLRENKIVTPAGIRNDGIAAPKKVEAYYYKGGMAKTLFTTALTANINFFKGKSYDGTKTGKGLQQYLEGVNRTPLADLINENMAKIETLSADLGEDFVAQVNDTEKRNKMLNVYDALQKVLKNFKPDMMSALSITNTSTDTDND